MYCVERKVLLEFLARCRYRDQTLSEVLLLLLFVQLIRFYFRLRKRQHLHVWVKKVHVKVWSRQRAKIMRKHCESH